MYVSNARDKNIITFASLVEKYLIKQGIPVFVIRDGRSYFRRTDKLGEILKNAPFGIRLLSREEVMKLE